MDSEVAGHAVVNEIDEALGGDSDDDGDEFGTFVWRSLIYQKQRKTCWTHEKARCLSDNPFLMRLFDISYIYRPKSI